MRDFFVAKNATIRAARLHPSLREKRLFRMKSELNIVRTLERAGKV
jgi:hypothetical protein